MISRRCTKYPLLDILYGAPPISGTVPTLELCVRGAATRFLKCTWFFREFSIFGELNDRKTVSFTFSIALFALQVNFNGELHYLMVVLQVL